MGYRSEVHLIISATGKLAIHLLNLKCKMLETKKPTEIFENGNTHYEWSAIKWYYHYPEIMEMIQLLKKLDDEQPEGSDSQYGFIRLGDKIGDIEEKGEPFLFGMRVEQYVSIS